MASWAASPGLCEGVKDRLGRYNTADVDHTQGYVQGAVDEDAIDENIYIVEAIFVDGYAYSQRYGKVREERQLLGHLPKLSIVLEREGRPAYCRKCCGKSEPLDLLAHVSHHPAIPDNHRSGREHDAGRKKNPPYAPII